MVPRRDSSLIAGSPAVANQGTGVHRAAVGNALYLAAFALLLAQSAALVLAYRYPPLVDWPEHLAQDSIVGRMHDARFGVAAFYRTTGWFLPYEGFRWLHIALAGAFGYSLGGRIALLAYLLGTPIAIAALLQRIGRDRWLSLATFALLADANFLWGFAPQSLATALAFAGIVVAIDFARRGGLARVCVLALLGIALFFTHAQQTAWWLASVAVIATEGFRRALIPRARCLILLGSLVPGAALLASYLALSGWLAGSAVRDEFAARTAVFWHSPLSTVYHVPFSSGLTTTGPTPWVLYLAVLILVTASGFAIAQRRKRDALGGPADRASDWSFVGPAMALLWWLMVFALPTEFRGQTVAPRVVSAALMALLWVPRLERPRSAREATILLPMRLGIVVASVASLAWTHGLFAQFDRSMQPMDAVIAAVPDRARVATLVFGARTTGFRLPVYLHAGGYVVAAHGGMASAGFTRTGVNYRPEVSRGSLLVNEMWMPTNLGWRPAADRITQNYDYIVVVKGPNYPGSPLAPGAAFGPTITRVLAEGVFELWRVDRSR